MTITTYINNSIQQSNRTNKGNRSSSPNRKDHTNKATFTASSESNRLKVPSIIKGCEQGIVKISPAIEEVKVKSLTPVIEGASKSINPNDIRFSKSSVNGAEEIIQSMKQNGWKGEPIDVVRMPDGRLTTIDNTRVLAAKNAGINVEANIHNYNDLLPADIELIDRLTTPKGVPTTWGDAVTLRIGKQNSLYRNTYPLGSEIIGWSGN